MIPKCWLDRCLLCGLMGLMGSGGAIALPTLVLAQIVPSNIVPDATLGAESSSVTPNVVIRDLPSNRIDGGAIRGINLFHSFEQFNVSVGRGIYFTNPTGVENILSRVTGSNRSEILGRLGVLGNANLFLLNPNGIVFSTNASLDVTGSFTATTANAIALGNQGFFSATQPASSQLLSIAPGALFFDQLTRQSGTIQNAGNLAAGRNLTLAADSLELQGQVRSGGNLTLQAQDTVRIRDSVTVPFIASAGGQLLVQGDRSVDIFALNHRDSSLFSVGDMVLRSANTISGDAHYTAYGNFRIEKIDGSPGNLYSPHDPIIRSLGDVSFDTYFGASLHILAAGAVTIGTVFITAPDATATTINPANTPALANVILSNGSALNVDGSIRPTLDVRAGVNPALINNPGIVGSGFFFDPLFNPTDPTITGSATSSKITVGDVVISAPDGAVLLTNQFQPNLQLPNGDITINGNGLANFGISVGTTSGNGGSVTIDSRGSIALATSRGIDTSTTDPGGASGSVTLIANNKISLDNDILRSSNSGTGKGGNITLKAREVSLANNSFLLSNNNGQGSAGEISLKGTDSVLLSNSGVSSGVSGGSGNGGSIDVQTKIFTLTGSSFFGSDTNGQGRSGHILINATDSVSLADQSDISSNVINDSLGDSSGILINTRSLTLTDTARLSALTVGKGNAGNIAIRASDSVSLSGLAGIIGSSQGLTDGTGRAGLIAIDTKSLSLTDSSQLNAITVGQGIGGNIAVRTGSLSLSNQALITTLTLGSGKAGSIAINADTVKGTDGAQVSANTVGAGDAGNIVIKANGVVSFDGTGIDGLSSGVLSQVESRASGRGGSVTIDAESLSLTNGAQLQATTSGKNDAGNVIVITRGSVSLQGQSTGILTSVQPGAVGDVGDIHIQSQSLAVKDGAQVQAIFFRGQGSLPGGRAPEGRERPGNIQIDASDFVDIAGTSSNGISSGLLTSTERGAMGQGGNTTVNTGTFRVANGGTVNAQTLNSSNGGNIFINARSFEAVNGGQVLTVTRSSGQAGNVTLNISNGIVISGTDPTFSNRFSQFGRDIVNNEGAASGLFASTDGNSIGNGGSISLSAENLNIDRGGLISTQSLGTGKAGNINVKVTQNYRATDGQIIAAATQAGGGNINLTAKSIFLLGNSDIKTNVLSGAGNGGNMTLSANSIVALDDSDILAFAQDGKGGNITLNTRAFFGQNYRPAPFGTDPATLDGNNRVDINASGTVSGIIALPDVSFLQNSLTEFPQTFTDTTQLLASSCIVRRGQANGSFTITGSGGLPQRPGDAPVSSFPTGEVRSVSEVRGERRGKRGQNATEPPDLTQNSKLITQNSPDRPWKIGDPIVEPQEIYQLANGDLVMSRDCSK